MQPSLLDLILTNEAGMIESLDYCSGLGKSDHVLIKCQLACYSATCGSPDLKSNLNRADFDRLNENIDRLTGNACQQWMSMRAINGLVTP